jgi:hypothetical protein
MPAREEVSKKISPLFDYAISSLDEKHARALLQEARTERKLQRARVRRKQTENPQMFTGVPS